ncbi:hypothetical protein DPMN_166028 [Dreissena polymorpha]|uniref:Uncharacterized protein n=1 Tax=Dreissena polymorpha TaxID=45954 RepID=A0A9D4IX76_DREPO|nr:hypothetical protein DPMN_166028 [Dreissena polymorpha]
MKLIFQIIIAQIQQEAELLTEISKLEAGITQRDDLRPQFAKPLFPKRLLLQLDPVVVTDIPIPVNVASSVPAPPQLLGFPLG